MLIDAAGCMNPPDRMCGFRMLLLLRRRMHLSLIRAHTECLTLLKTLKKPRINWVWINQLMERLPWPYSIEQLIARGGIGDFESKDS